MFNYKLPKERIAIRPCGLHSSRDQAKLLHVRPNINQPLALEDRCVRDLPELLREGDLLVLNNTKVRPFRFFPRINEKECEVLLVTQLESIKDHTQVWMCLARPMKRFRQGMQVELSASITLEVLGRNEEGDRLILKLSCESEKSLDALIESEGLLPIPPYIRGGHSDELDVELYQTVFADIPGSIAAPTAGLHFTPSLFESLSSREIGCVDITLHVGVGSFLPVAADSPNKHHMIAERFHIPEDTRIAIRDAKEEGRRIVAIGTTVVRALEGKVLDDASFFVKRTLEIKHEFEETNIFISPGFEFQVVDALFTNFHQPRSTHLALVSAFVGEDVIEQAYRHALSGEYRFLSYGDAMFLDSESSHTHKELRG